VAPTLRLALDVRLPSETQRGENVAEVVTAVAAIVVEFHRGRQLARLLSVSADRDRIATLCHSLHASLDQKRIALELANDGAAALKIDRISVLLAHGTGFRLEAVTSVSELNRRANACRAIEQLVEELRPHGQSLPWTSASASDSVDAAVQVACRSLRESGATRVRIEPLGPQRGVSHAAQGVAVFESFGTESPNSDFDGVAEV